MDESDSVLIRRLVSQGDAEAFSTVVSQYADMVYSTSRRVLGYEAQAAEVMQETFFQFLKNADRVTGSIASWLHRVTTRRAVDLVRQDASRRREANYADGIFIEAEEWGEIEPFVDEALEELPDESRDVLVLHYLHGKTMTEIAAAKGLSRPTISRRAATALEQLRERLRSREVIVGLAVLSTLLANSTQAALVAVLNGLGKISLALAASASAEFVAAPAATTTVVGLKTVLIATAVVLTTGVAWHALRRGSSEQPSSLPAAATNPLNSTVAAASGPEQETNLAGDSPTSLGAIGHPGQISAAANSASAITYGIRMGSNLGALADRLPGGRGGFPAPIQGGGGARFVRAGKGTAGLGFRHPGNQALLYGLGFSNGRRFSLPGDHNISFLVGGSAGEFSVRGTWGGATSAGLGPGAPTFSTNYSFSQFWTITNGFRSMTRSNFSSGSSPIAPGGSLHHFP